MGNTAFRINYSNGTSGYSGYSGYSGPSLFPLWVPHTWSMAGLICPEANFQFYLCPVYFMVPSGKEIKIKYISGSIVTGTSVVVHLFVDDVYINWGVTATTTGANWRDSSDYILDNTTGSDKYYKIKPTIVSTDGDPTMLSFSITCEYNA